MNRSSVTAGLIILLALCVMGTAVLSYYYVISIRNLSTVQMSLIEEQRTVQADREKVRALLNDLAAYGRTNQAIVPLIQSLSRVPLGTNRVDEIGGADE